MSMVAMCPWDGEPLVSTFAWRKYEFYCLACGGKFGWLDPQPADETPELLALTEAVKAEFLALGADDLIGEGMHRRDCAQCSRESHAYHASDAEWEAHRAALARLEARATRQAARA